MSKIRKYLRIFTNNLNFTWTISFIFNSLQTTLVNIFFGYSFKLIFDSLDQNGSTTSGVLLILIGGFYAISLIPLFGYVMEKEQNRFRYKLSKLMLGEVLSKSYTDVSNKHSVKYLNVLQNDLPKIANFCGWNSVVFFQALISGISSLIIIGIYSIEITIVSIVFGFLLLLINVALNKRIKVITINIRELIQLRLRKIIDYINNFLLIKLYNLRDDQMQEISNISMKTRNEEKLHFNILNILNSFGSFSVNVFFYAGIIAYGAVLINRNEISFGSLLLIIQLSSGTVFLFSSIGEYFNNMQQSASSLAGLDEVFKDKLEGTIKYSPGECISKIDVSNVCYRYSDNSSWVMINFNLIINFPDRLAIIGKNGSGKSTFIKILLGLIKPDFGEVRINGINIEDIDQRYISSRIGIVPQEIYFFEDTIYNNIVLNRKDISEDVVKSLLKSVQLEDWVESLQKGIKGYISTEGSNISSGQRKRLALARALVLKPDLLILDEFDSNMDIGLANLIIENITKQYPKMSIIIITHTNTKLKNMGFKINKF